MTPHITHTNAPTAPIYNGSNAAPQPQLHPLAQLGYNRIANGQCLTALDDLSNPCCAYIAHADSKVVSKKAMDLMRKYTVSKYPLLRVDFTHKQGVFYAWMSTMTQYQLSTCDCVTTVADVNATATATSLHIPAHVPSTLPISTQYPSLIVKLYLSGIGYRVFANGKNPEGHEVLQFSLGMSHPVKFIRPRGRSVDVNKAFTEFNLSTPAATTDKQGKYFIWRIHNTVYQLSSLRPRTPYKGTGILVRNMKYPTLKVTKSAKK